MILYGNDLLSNPPMKTQVCIVGTGPAGVTLAWYLVRKGIDVTLLEGSRPYDRTRVNDPIPQGMSGSNNENELLYNGEAVGLFTTNEPDFLIRPSPGISGGPRERDRIYGGTSTHWGGQSRPLDPITFEKRSNFPGWPITRDDLDPWYEKACDFMQLYGSYFKNGIAGYNFTAEFWANELNQEVAQLDDFDVAMYQFPEQSLLQFQARKVNGKTIGESSARVILNASVLHIEEQNGSVNKLTVGVLTPDPTKPTRQAGTFTIAADAYVLACGAVANARLLLLSNVGNQYDHVGRYFMGHPIAINSGAVNVNGGPGYLTQKEQDLLSYQPPGKPGVSSVAGLLTPTAAAARENEVGRCWFGTRGTGDFYHELIPERDSRVMLSDTMDVFGQPQTKVDWQLNANAERSYNVLTGLFTAAVKAHGGGDCTVQDWNTVVKPAMVFNGHHIGTTRMSARQEDGVVDANLKMHRVDNLYVAGSSVWASTGISNPTFSIITFSIRLAEHLAEQVSKPQAMAY